MATACYGIALVSCGRRGGLSQLIRPSNLELLAVKRDVKFRVRSTAEDDETKEPAAAPPTPTPNPPKAKSSTRFGDLLAFSGPGPERINGRLAMTGFVAAIGAEVGSGQDIFAQVQNGGLQWFLFTSVLLSVASLVPLISGQTAESKSGAVMSSDAELWNGRFAMLGLLALALTEYLKGGALVSL